jgi:hypothetical protein
MLQGKIPAMWAKTLREWGELMFTTVASKKVEAPTFSIENLLQIENQQVVMQPPVERRRVVEVSPAPPMGPPAIEVDGLILELDFTNVDP